MPIQNNGYQFDPQLIFTTTPNSQRMFLQHPANGGGTITSFRNSLGLIGSEVKSKPSTSYRIAVYGDSFIEAYFSKLEDTFTHQLESQLHSKGYKKVEVLNAGVMGYGPDQAFLRAKSQSEGLKPDLIVFALYAGNDFGDLIRNKLFMLTDQKELQENQLNIKSHPEFPGPLSWKNIELINRIKLSKKKLLPGQAQLTADFTKYLCPQDAERAKQEFEDYIVNRNFTPTNLFDDHEDCDMLLYQSSDLTKYKINLMDKLLKQIVETFDAQKIPVMFLVIPSLVSQDFSKDSNQNISFVADTLSELAQKHNAPTLNLFPDFAKKSPTDLYFKFHDVHWNNNGQALAGQLVADFIEKKFLENKILKN